jgi:hypothetical protein
MLDTFDSDNRRDFGARYINTYGFLKSDDEKHLVYLEDISDTSVYFRTDDCGILFHAKIDAGVVFEFIQSRRGFYLTNEGEIFYIERVPARQWKRGIARSNTQLMRFNSGAFEGMKLSLKLLGAVLSATEQDLAKRQRDASSKVFSRFFACSKDTLYFFTKACGKVDHTNRVITLGPNGEMLMQELSDTIRRNAFEYTVRKP